MKKPKDCISISRKGIASILLIGIVFGVILNISLDVGKVHWMYYVIISFSLWISLFYFESARGKYKKSTKFYILRSLWTIFLFNAFVLSGRWLGNAGGLIWVFLLGVTFFFIPSYGKNNLS